MADNECLSDEEHVLVLRTMKSTMEMLCELMGKKLPLFILVSTPGGNIEEAKILSNTDKSCCVANLRLFADQLEKLAEQGHAPEFSPN